MTNLQEWTTETTEKTVRFWKLSATCAMVVMGIFLFFSCGTKKAKMPEFLVPAKIEIEGNLGKQFVLVAKEYSLSTNSNSFTVDIVRTHVPLYSFDRVGIGIEIFDKDGKSISLQRPDLNALTSFNPVISLLQLQTGNRGSAVLKLKAWPDGLSDAKTFKITIQSNGSGR
jgi:hypothetical protein